MNSLNKKILDEYGKIKESTSQTMVFELSKEEIAKYKQTIDYLLERKYLSKRFSDDKFFYAKSAHFAYFEEQFRAEINEPLPKLFELYSQVDEVEKEFGKSGSSEPFQWDCIYSSPKFIDWKDQCIYELEKLPQNPHVCRLLETLNTFNGWSDKQKFSESIAGLKTIVNNYEDFIVEPLLSTETQGDAPLMRDKKIFISHAKLDKSYVSVLVDLLEYMGLDDSNLFCSSVPGFGIPLDGDIFECLRDNFNTFDLHVIFVHSKNFYDSAVCLNEMGAAWIAQSAYTSILLPTFDFSDMVGVVNSKKLALKLDGDLDEVKHLLNELYDNIIDKFDLKRKSPTSWERKRDSFIKAINDIANSSADTMSTTHIDKDVLTMLETASISTIHTDTILKYKDLQGISIHAGNTQLNIKGDNRDTAKWEHVLELAIANKFVKQTDSKGKIFKLTATGYDVIKDQ